MFKKAILLFLITIHVLCAQATLQAKAASMGLSSSEISSLVNQYESQKSDTSQQKQESTVEKDEDTNKSAAVNTNSYSRIEQMYAIFETSQSDMVQDSDLQSDEKKSFTFDSDRAGSQFGYDIFKRKFSMSFDDIPVREDYILGPGDTLMIYIWGMLEDQISVKIDNEGAIYLPKVGRVQLAGVKCADVEDVIRKSLGKHFSNFQLSVAMGKLRSIKLFVLGDVNNPGEYHASSLASVFQSLYLAGGPTKMGTLRQIKVLRNNKAVEQVDLYDYFIGGKNNLDIQLSDLDTIFVSPIGPVAKISGMVKRPSIYELGSKDSAYDLIMLAGGLTAATYYNRIQIKRIVKGEAQTVIDQYFKDESSMKKALKGIPLEDGDWIKVLPISTVLRNYVSISGNVSRPGDYELQPNMSLHDLITSAQGLLDDTYFKRVEVYRFISPYQREIFDVDLAQDGAFKLQEWDSVRVYSAQEILGTQYVYSEGAFQNPRKIQLYKDMTVADLLFKSRPAVFAKLDQAELIRQNEEGERFVIHLDVTDVLTNPTSTANMLLMPNDVLVLREAVHDLKKHIVTVSGEVKFPGEFVYEPGDTLSDVLKRAGGLTDRAFLRGLVFQRQSSKKQAIIGHQKLVKDEEQRFIYEKSKVSPFLGSDDASMMQFQLAAQSQALALLKDQVGEYSGRVIISINSYDELEDGEFDLVLEDGDTLSIPPQPSTIQIVGGVQSPSAVKFVEGKDVEYYVDLLGGYSEHANKKSISILKPNGMISKDLSVVERGDLIYIPEKFKIPFSWSLMFRYVGNTFKSITSVVVSYALVNSAFNNLNN